MSVALGLAVPPHTPHAISVSLPTWRDNVGYEEGEKRVVDSMVSGYPRFFIHLSIRKLESICEQKYVVGNEKCMLFPTQRIAEQCRSFIERRSSLNGSPSVNARLVHLLICPEDKQTDGNSKIDRRSIAGSCADLHIVLFPRDATPIAKEFWQHTGQGISSRLAEKCLSLLSEDTPSVLMPTSPVASRFPSKGQNRHYSAVKSPSKSPPAEKTQFPPSVNPESLDSDHSVYLEERYGRNLPLAAASFAKHALRSRVAGTLLRDNTSECKTGSCTEQKELILGPSTRGVTEVGAHDVHLYPSGMAAIWNAHNMALAVLPPAKSICFGFPYTDTLKILQKWGPGCHFFGFGVDSDVDQLEKLLEEEVKRDPSTPPILALFTEFPSNPLLRSANLPRLRALADKYDFLIIIDETIGNFINVEVLPYADIVVSSLTKVFSGASNVMGGSLVLNPQGRHYAKLKRYLDDHFEDIYFDEDAIYMERNSRDFKRRIRVIDANAEIVCDFLRSRSLAVGATSPAVKEVFYPKYITPENYNHCRIKDVSAEDGKSGGYGGLFSLTFTSVAASVAFYDTLACYKGPSLGTNFTLACPFTILAHFGELDWAAQFGVEEGLVRISVGMEDAAVLLQLFEEALKAAEAVTKSA
ncbi:pyridoxal phosphate-dependent transferase [Crassisporium funariophilum]|nr:pyridoxal phosphate-dependent transferase [Crassisporium funariophilum]